MAKTDLTAARLRELFHYNEDTGIFTRLVSRSRAKAGDTLKGPDKEGYLQVMIDWGKYKVHRLAWLYVHGVWPIGHIDHINGSHADNRIANLREATDAFNQQNRNAKNGRLGTGFDKRRNTWTARIVLNRRDIYLGSFGTREEAHAAYLVAKESMHAFNPVPRC